MAQLTPSLTARVILVAGLVFVAPLAYLGLSSLVERALAGRTEVRMDECLDALEALPAERREDAARAVCARHHLTVQFVPVDGPPRAVWDGLVSEAADDELGDVLFGPERREALTTWLQGHPAPAPDGCEVLPESNVRVCSASRTIAGGTLRVVGSSRSAHDDRYALRRQLGAMMALGAILAIAVLAGMRRVVQGPIDRLVADVASGGDRLPEDRPRELAEVARAFNQLLDARERQDAEHRAFLADLAHEMKGAIATVRAASDALAESELDAATRRQVRGRGQAGTERLERLVAQFLELARSEAAPVEVEEVELSALIAGVVASEATPTGIEVSIEAAPCTVRGAPERLESAVRNLVANALTFAKGAVRVELTIEPQSVLLRVIDDGPGIPPEARARVFDRFFSVRPAERPGGTGLGLAIAAAVARAHGGTVEATEAPGGGAALSMRLPR